MTLKDEAEQVKSKADRMAKARRSTTSPWKELVHVGVLGWMFILPVLLGLWGGRALEQKGLLPHASLMGLVLGAAIGAYGVWRQVKKSLDEGEDSP